MCSRGQGLGTSLSAFLGQAFPLPICQWWRLAPSLLDRCCLHLHLVPQPHKLLFLGELWEELGPEQWTTPGCVIYCCEGPDPRWVWYLLLSSGIKIPSFPMTTSTRLLQSWLNLLLDPYCKGHFFKYICMCTYMPTNKKYADVWSPRGPLPFPWHSLELVNSSHQRPGNVIGKNCPLVSMAGASSHHGFSLILPSPAIC